MDQIEYTDEKGRKYQAYSNGDGKHIIIGPPEGLVDSLSLPEPFATHLHNILFERGLINLKSINQSGNSLTGALQEALGIDVQRLHEAYFKFENVQEVHNG
jgi:hypothetical protein